MILIVLFYFLHNIQLSHFLSSIGYYSIYNILLDFLLYYHYLYYVLKSNYDLMRYNQLYIQLLILMLLLVKCLNHSSYILNLRHLLVLSRLYPYFKFILVWLHYICIFIIKFTSFYFAIYPYS